uniref:Uncharacterized protein n=1 Tax=Oryza punctata TaxID=4537 RepID=A0A0E0KH12_ORYPU
MLELLHDDRPTVKCWSGGYALKVYIWWWLLVPAGENHVLEYPRVGGRRYPWGHIFPDGVV